MIAKSGRWGHRPRWRAAVGVLTNRNLGNKILFKQFLRLLEIIKKECANIAVINQVKQL